MMDAFCWTSEPVHFFKAGNVSARYWHESITQALQIWWLHFHDADLPLQHALKSLYWGEIWWLWRMCSTVTSRSSSRNQFEFSFVDGHARQQYSGRLWRLNRAQLVLRGPRFGICLDPCFHVVYAEFWPDHPNVAAETRRVLSDQDTFFPVQSFLLSNYGEPKRTAASVSWFLIQILYNIQ